VRAILCRELAKDERFEVIGYARDGQDGVEKVTALRPDVITLDVEMPAGGTEALLGSDSLGCERLGGNFYRRTAEAAQLRRTA
jgi:AmiR/NasT family two-component response regulator